MTDKVSTAGTLEVFRVFGVPVRLHFTFVLLLAFLVVTDLSHAFSGTFAVFLLGLFASMLMHDLAHASVAAGMQVRTLEIVMLPIGGLARYEKRLKPMQELWISLAGPFANLLVAAGICGYIAATRQGVQVDLNALLAPS